MSYILIAIISVVIASISIIGGLGGGIILVPILTQIFGIPLKTVIGSVLISLTVPATIGAWGAWRREELDFKLAFLFEIPTAFGAFIGAKVTASLPDEIIVLLFGTLSLFLSVNMVNNSQIARKNIPKKISRFWIFVGSVKPVLHLSKQDKKYHVSVPSLIIFGLIIGTLSGMLGVGGGWIKTPLMIIGFGIPTGIATGSALFMIMITALVGGITHISEGNIDSWLIMSLSIGLGLGANIGNFLKKRMKPYQISFVLGVTLFVISILFMAPVIFGWIMK